MSSLGFHCSFSLSPHHSPDVEFCGYCITHPSESKINFRIQTRGMDVHVLFVSGLFVGFSLLVSGFSHGLYKQRKALFSLFSASHLHLLCPVALLGCSELCAVALLFPSCRAEQHLPAEA